MTRIPAALLDLLLVTVFVAIGRWMHDEPVFSGLLSSAWPFWASFALAWGILFAVKERPISLSSALVVWLITAFGGMALRVVTGIGAETSFIIVGTLFLCLFLCGWRVIANLIVRKRSQATISN